MGICMAVSERKPPRQTNQPRQQSSITRAFVAREDERNKKFKKFICPLTVNKSQISLLVQRFYNKQSEALSL